MNRLKDILQCPITKGLSLDDPLTTNLRHVVLRKKPFLVEIYREWYRLLFDNIPCENKRILEIGAGAGYASELNNKTIRTDVLPSKSIHVECDGHSLPFSANTFHAILMINVLHHLQDLELFFQEASRCLEYGGSICMIEPWNTPWSKFVYTHFHHEAFDPCALHWGCEQGGPLSHANGALPWIVFSRDLHLFRSKYPQFTIQVIRPIMPFVYLLSGGISLRNLMPGFTYSFWRTIERSFDSNLGLFALIVIKKISTEEKTSPQSH